MPIVRRFVDNFQRKARLPKDSPNTEPASYGGRRGAERKKHTVVKKSFKRELYLEPEDVKDFKPTIVLPEEPIDLVKAGRVEKKQCWPRYREAGANKIWTMEEQLHDIPAGSEEFVAEDVHYTLLSELKDQIIETFGNKHKRLNFGNKGSVPEDGGCLRGVCDLFGKTIRYKVFYLRFPVVCPRCRHDIFRRKVTPASMCCCCFIPFLGWPCAYSFLEYACDYCGECWDPDDVLRYCRDLMELKFKLSTKSVQEVLPFAPQHFH